MARATKLDIRLLNGQQHDNRFDYLFFLRPDLVAITTFKIGRIPSVAPEDIPSVTILQSFSGTPKSLHFHPLLYDALKDSIEHSHRQDADSLLVKNI